MKKFTILLIALVGMTGAKAQGCLPDGIEFNYQEQIDNFQTNYPGCTEIEGDVIISDSYSGSITNLNGLNVITSIGGDFFIGYNKILFSLTGLEGLTSIAGNLEICYNEALTSLTGLEGLTSIENILRIEGNDVLTSLTSLEGLTSIGGDIFIFFNYALFNLTGLEGLTSIGGNLSIIINIALTSLTGLEGLTSIGGNLEISFNDALTSLMGLEGLTSIGGTLYIGDNEALTNLTGLDNLTSIAGDLCIGGGPGYYYTNSTLTDISGLENITAGTINNLIISYNTSLSTCEVQSICDYLAAPNGTVEIHDNAPGCNSQEEVDAACLTEVEETHAQAGITIIPNPSKDKITISSPAIKGNTQLSIFNVSGEKVIERQLTVTETQLDISALPRGVYFVRVQDEKGVQVAKMVKE